MVLPLDQAKQLGDFQHFRRLGSAAASNRSKPVLDPIWSSNGLAQASAMTKVSVAVSIISIPVRCSLCVGAAVGGHTRFSGA